MSTSKSVGRKTLANVGRLIDFKDDTLNASASTELVDLSDLTSLYAKCEKFSAKLTNKAKEATKKRKRIDLRLDLFSGTKLKGYQEKGVEWVVNLQNQAINGILGDEMGLGKTAQSIAVISHLISSGNPGPFLVLAPLSTISNWEKEFKRFTPLIPVVLFHGSREHREELLLEFKKKSTVTARLSCYPVVIAPYHTFMVHVGNFSKYKWKFLVFDEASVIKNDEAKLYKLAASLPVSSKLLLTGTPLQNNLRELFNLLKFIVPDVFQDYKPFQSWIEEINKLRTRESFGDEGSLDFVSTMHQILAPFFLRRTKKNVDLTLPPKKHLIVYCPMTIEQKNLYESVLTRAEDSQKSTQMALIEVHPSNAGCRLTRRSSAVPSKGQSEGSKRAKRSPSPLSIDSDSGFSSISTQSTQLLDELNAANLNTSNVLALLRNIVAHPWILRKSQSCEDLIVQQSILKSSGKLQVFDLLLKELLANGHKIIVCSQFIAALDIIACYLDKEDVEYFYLSGETKLQDRQLFIDAFNRDDSPQKVFLLSTRAGGMGINLTGADTVVFYDTDWNPQMDLQAADRCHRIGQTKPVVIYRLICKESIDEKILESATNKRRLERLLIDCGQFEKGSTSVQSSTKPLNQKELLKILKTVDWDAALDNEYLDPEKIAKLADRKFVFEEYDKPT